MPNIKKLRTRSFDRQAGRCFYCRQPMWLTGRDAFAATHNISRANAGLLQASAEHLRARCDGGAGNARNVVAACVYCNGHRHRARVALSPERFMQRVRKQLAAGKWHGLRLSGDLAPA